MIYFLVDKKKRAVRVGYSANPKRRIKTHQMSNASDLHVLGVIPGELADERAMHARFDATFQRLPGRAEWYRATPGLLRHARAMIRTADEVGFAMRDPFHDFNLADDFSGVH